MAEPRRHRIAFQGEPGAYGEEALRVLHGADVEAVPCLTFRAVFEAVAEGRVHGGVVPVESSLGGPVAETVDLLLEHDVPVTGELSLRIRHCLLAPPGQTLEGIQQALSHPQALAQCAGYLRRRGITPLPETNTAIAARKVAEEAPPHTAAIASRLSASLYGLTVLEEGVEDSPDNYTRFLALGPAPERPWTRRKTALALTVENGPGALYRALSAFSSRGLNVARLESRPQRRAWEYVWCLDVDGALEDPRVREAVEAAQAACITLRVLGSYGVV
ncbi:prephenate dehydratase [Myxococcus sp. Y35]|uniref:prephenate dehydratase n=1 Tax=Pseudomyxococcus flavus TaxID=3115648 RepID=UPI003CFB8FF4